MDFTSQSDLFRRILLAPLDQPRVQPLATQPHDLTRSGLAVPPPQGPSVLRFAAMFMTLTDYMPPGRQVDRAEADRNVAELSVDMPHADALQALAALNHFAHHPEKAGPAVDFLRSCLSPESLSRFDAMAPHRQVFGRQPVLRAMTVVLRTGHLESTRRLPPGLAPILMVHAAGDALDDGPPSATDTIGGWPSDAVLELIANGIFHLSNDKWALMWRQATLWRSHGELAGHLFEGNTAADLLVDASGLEPEDFLAIGYALTAHVASWTPGTSIPVRLADSVGIGPEKIAAFARLVCASPEDFASRLAAEPRSTWDFLGFQSTPVLTLPEGYVVLDESLLWEKMTSGLFWIVFDYLKATVSDSAALRWMQAWGEIVEAAVGDSLRKQVPRVLDDSQLFYTENDLHRAYGESRRAADFVLDCGDRLIAFEVVSHRITTGTRVDLARDAFDADIEKLVTKKVRQLDETVSCLCTSERPLTGIEPSRPRSILPVLIAAMGFPYMEPVVAHIRQIVGEAGLLAEPRGSRRVDGERRIGPLCIIDLRELELLEGAVSAGGSIDVLLMAWQAETGGIMSYWDWATSEPGRQAPRSPRMRTEGVAVINEIRRRLRMADDTGEPWEPPDD